MECDHAAGRITRPLRHNGENYHGINIIVLWMMAESQGFNCPYWLTFQQAKQLGGFVKKGEHGSPVVYTSTFKKNDTDESGEEVERDCRFLKQYTVFNACQVEGLPEHFYALAEPPKETLQRIEQADRFFANTKADIRTAEIRRTTPFPATIFACRPSRPSAMRKVTRRLLAHELTHWTRHESRLNRDFGRKRFGDEGYAIEELVAELASAFLCADLQITPELRDDHASYIENWLTVLEERQAGDLYCSIARESGG